MRRFFRDLEDEDAEERRMKKKEVLVDVIGRNLEFQFRFFFLTSPETSQEYVEKSSSSCSQFLVWPSIRARTLPRPE